jgi:hypothetical protein
VTSNNSAAAHERVRDCRQQQAIERVLERQGGTKNRAGDYTQVTAQQEGESRPVRGETPNEHRREPDASLRIQPLI